MASDEAPAVAANGGTSRQPEGDERTPLLSNGVKAGTSSAVPEANGSKDDEEEQTVVGEEVHGFKLWLILGTCWLGVFLGAIDSTIIATLSAPISSEFESLSLLSWLATGYLISNAACQPISGRLTDIFGRRAGLIFSNIFFAAGNLICGLARDENVMILGRIVAGIGGGGLMSISTFTASDLVPLRNRGIIQGVGNICYGAGAMLGGIFGGAINDHSAMGWRLAFLIQVPPVIVSAILVWFLVNVPPKVSGKSYLARIDFTGALSLLVFLVLLLLGLDAGGNLVPWTHPLVLTTIPLSVVAFVFFIVWESRARQPVIPVKLLMNRTVWAACMTNMLCCMVNFAVLFYGPLYLQVRGSSATDAGLIILFGPIGISLNSVLSGWIMKRTGKYLPAAIAAVTSQVVCVVILCTLDDDSPRWLLGIAYFFVGAGQGGMLTTTLLACLASVDHSQQAVITSATYAFRSCGGTLGITAASALYQNVLKERLLARFADSGPDAPAQIRRIRDSLDALRDLPPGWHDGVIASFMEAFRGVWFLALGLILAALLCVCLMRQHKLHSTLKRDEDQDADRRENGEDGGD